MHGNSEANYEVQAAGDGAGKGWGKLLHKIFRRKLKRFAECELLCQRISSAATLTAVAQKYAAHCQTKSMQRKMSARLLFFN